MNPLHLFHVDTFLPKPGRDASGRKKCLLEALSAVHPISSNMRQGDTAGRPWAMDVVSAFLIVIPVVVVE